MITPENITQTHETDPIGGGIRSRTELRLEFHHAHHRGSDAESIAYFDNDAKRQIWRYIYGNLSEEIERLRCQAMQFAPDHVRMALSEEFDRLADKVRDPFIVQPEPFGIAE